MLLDCRLGQAELRRDLLVGEKCGQPKTLFLTRAEPLDHRPLRYCGLARTFLWRRPAAQSERELVIGDQ